MEILYRLRTSISEKLASFKIKENSIALYDRVKIAQSTIHFRPRIEKLKPDALTIIIIISAVVSLSLVGIQQFYGNNQNSAIAQTQTPTIKPSSTFPAIAQAVIAEATAKPSGTLLPEQANRGVNATEISQYTVKSGDTLWSIATTAYNDGFQWRTIAQANNLTDPRQLKTGTVLNLPKKSDVAMQGIPKNQPTNQAVQPSQTLSQSKTYTVVQGDNLWQIAQTQYGNPYLWPKIAQTNNLANPRLIHAGNVLTIPPQTASP